MAFVAVRRSRTAPEPSPVSQRGLRHSGVSLKVAQVASLPVYRIYRTCVPGGTFRPSSRRGRPRLRPEPVLSLHRAAPNDRLPHVVCDCRGGARSGARARRLHVCVCARLGLHDRRPAGVRELPRHERAIRRLDQEQPSLGGRVQRLSRAPQPGRQVCDEGQQRLLALVLLHDRAVFPSQSGRCQEAGRSRRRIAAAATSPSSRRWGRPHTPDRATSRVSAVTGPWAIWNLPRPTFPIRRGEPCPTRNQAECAGGAAVPS